MTNGLLIPVEILAIGTFYAGVAHQLAVGSKESLVGLVEDIQLKSVGNQVLRGVCTSCGSIVAGSHAVVLHVEPLSLHPLAGAQTVVLGNTA